MECGMEMKGTIAHRRTHATFNIHEVIGIQSVGRVFLFATLTETSECVCLLDEHYRFVKHSKAQ